MTLIFSIKQTGVPAGGVLVGVMLPTLTLAFGWQIAALTSAALCALAALLLQPVRAGMDDDRGRPFRFSLRSVTVPLMLNLRHPPLRRLAFAAIAFAAMQVSFLSFFITYLTQEVEVSLITAGAIFSGAQIAAVVGRILWGGLADSLITPRLMLIGLAFGMSVLACVFAAITPDWPILLIVLVSILLSATAVGWNGVIVAEVARQAPAGQVSEATAGFMSINFLGVIIGPTGVSLLVGASDSYALGFGVLAAFTATAGVLFLHPGALKTPGISR
jgi:MFS family permease